MGLVDPQEGLLFLGGRSLPSAPLLTSSLEYRYSSRSNPLTRVSLFKKLSLMLSRTMRHLLI